MLDLIPISSCPVLDGFGCWSCGPEPRQAYTREEYRLPECLKRNTHHPHIHNSKMVLRIPETGLQLESSAKTADTLPMQAFAITLSDSVIEDLIQCAQNGEDIRLSLGNVPVSRGISISNTMGAIKLTASTAAACCHRFPIVLPADNRKSLAPATLAILLNNTTVLTDSSFFPTRSLFSTERIWKSTRYPKPPRSPTSTFT